MPKTSKPAPPTGPSIEPPTRRLLLVDDEEPILNALRRVFEDDYEVFDVRDGDAALEMARKVRPHVIISDQSMPNMTGVELLAKVKEELPNTVRVLITGYTDYGSLVDAVNAAQVHHYFEKPFHTVDLKTVVDVLLRTHVLEEERAVLTRQLQTSVSQLESANGQLASKEVELQRMLIMRTQELSEANRKLSDANTQLEGVNRQLSEQAMRDSLTGLFNHRYLIEHATIELARSQRYQRRFCMLFIDVDNFKPINDTFGHTTGDKVLRAVADILRPSHEGLRRSDFAARYGGEEFCVLLPETGLDGGAIKAARICESVATFPWVSISPSMPRVTVSVGVAAYPEHADTLDGLIETADAAQYEAKRAGKNRVVMAGERTK